MRTLFAFILSVFCLKIARTTVSRCAWISRDLEQSRISISAFMGSIKWIVDVVIYKLATRRQYINDIKADAAQGIIHGTTYCYCPGESRYGRWRQIRFIQEPCIVSESFLSYLVLNKVLNHRELIYRCSNLLVYWFLNVTLFDHAWIICIGTSHAVTHPRQDA